ncbi:hypothetical protein EVAR_27190_1 [Eumeta japonica]|uniref:Uncharacterized protein n=1 Tax=Eumeta variegata TaxID=151549 RepID=A0A4C1VYX1_EUMVA|nr:hypothetical protein EVAR_27190_1 [Eumeta japonica]
MTGHGTLIIVSVYLPPHKPLLRSDIEPCSHWGCLHCLGSDHLPVLLKLGSSTGENPNIATKTIIDWKRVSTALEEVTPNLNVIPDDIVSNNDIDTAIGALTKHIRSVVKRCQRKVPANSDRRGLPADVRELIRAKNAALRRASIAPHSNIGLEREPSNAK